MEPEMSEDLRFPIGKFEKNADVTTELRNRSIAEIAALPANIRAAVSGLSDQQLDTVYRDDGWTVRQVVHHIPDSHLNSYIRFKWALTEEKPVIKAYHEDRWAELGDSKMPIENSLTLLESLHFRWIELLNSTSETDFAKVLVHPESGEWSLSQMVTLYAWHGKHHTAHITRLRERNHW
jgi:DinB superfamily